MHMNYGRWLEGKKQIKKFVIIQRLNSKNYKVILHLETEIWVKKNLNSKDEVTTLGNTGKKSNCLRVKAKVLQLNVFRIVSELRLFYNSFFFYHFYKIKKLRTD